MNIPDPKVSSLTYVMFYSVFNQPIEDIVDTVFQ